MVYGTYDSPVGKIVLRFDGQCLSGLWFAGGKYAPEVENCDMSCRNTFADTYRWLDAYFDGEVPGFLPELSLSGTDFQLMVWGELLKIPYGKTETYGELAKRVAGIMGVERMSAQAVGGAVGRNPISIIVPCHRVVGTDGSLTGYAGGLDVKRRLLSLEKAHVRRF